MRAKPTYHIHACIFWCVYIYLSIYIYSTDRAKRWEPSEWIVEQIEWRKYVTNKHNNKFYVALRCDDERKSKSNEQCWARYSNVVAVPVVFMCCFVCIGYELNLPNEVRERDTERADTKEWRRTNTDISNEQQRRLCMMLSYTCVWDRHFVE